MCGIRSSQGSSQDATFREREPHAIHEDWTVQECEEVIVVTWREVLGLLLMGALCACTQPINRCETAADCRSGALCLQNVCVYDGEIDSQACDRPCATYEACSALTLKCQPRFTGLVVSPSDATVDGGTLSVRAELRVTPGFAANFPETLNIGVTRGDGGTVASLPTTTEGDGVYTTQWNPSGEGAYRLTAAHPEQGGPSTTVGLTVDTTGPLLSVVPAASSSREPDGGFIYKDPAAPSAWRRDQTATVRVESSSTDLDPRSVSVLVRGFDGGVALEGLSLASATPCEGKAYCATVDVPLWKPGLPAFRGEFAVEVSAKDRVGNQTSGRGSIPVTRWKWRHGINSAVITAAPAVGNKGVLYVGTTNGGNNDGRLLALSEDGRLLWDANTGAVVASPAVGNTLLDGSERVYAAQRKASTNRVGFYAGSSVFHNSCADFTSTTALVQSALAIGQVSVGSAAETVYGVYSGRNGGTLFAARPDENDPLLQCPTNLSVGDVVAPGSMLASGSSVILGTSTGRLKSYALGTSGLWNSSAQWDRPLGVLNPTAMAVVDGRIFGGSNDGSNSRLFTASLDGGQDPTNTPTGSPTWNASIGGSPETRVVVGLQNNNLLALDAADGGTQSIQTPSEVIKGAPVWGAGGYVYTASSTSGVIQARRPLDHIEWQFDAESPIEASMNLDCSRAADGGVLSGMPGVLYAASQDGRVFAIVVDSPGLDSTAPWPKYQHDSRNTGNPDTPLTSCP
uniref:Cell surface protein n=1 Tax=Cystobacter fuscus TaxID=43 RepID=A0A3Q8I332_9BACT|nr:cell surface protein [Cystobacter fuscus]